MQHVHAHVPVTALAWYGERYILAGEGGYLVVYSIDGTVLSRTSVFANQAVHGIAVLDNASESSAIVWGGNLLRPLLLECVNGALEILLGNVHNAKDWILDAGFATATPLLAAFVTAHDAFTTLRIRYPQASPRHCPPLIVEPRVPGSKCILYSAHLKWLSASQCLVASGTAFGDVNVSSITIHGEDDALTERQVHFSFSAHEGSVFGVRLSPELCATGQDVRRLLASCSDDRTVRLWDLSDLHASSVHGYPPRDTGFGSSLYAEQHAPPCLVKAMGHVSRVWHVRFAAATHTDHLVRLRSFGEDAAVILWTVGVKALKHAMDRSSTLRAHSGKNIWSVACNSESGLIATGGADGAIAVFGEDTRSINIMEIPGPTSVAFDFSERYQSYAFVATNVVVATTGCGSLVQITLPASGDASAVERISPALQGLDSYSLVVAVPGVAFAGGADGLVYSWHLKRRTVHQFARVNGKISGLFAQEQCSGVIALLACTVNSQAASLFVLDYTDDADVNEMPKKSFELVLGKDFVPTSFAHCAQEHHNCSILGSRDGSIAVYRFSADAERPLSCSQLVIEAHSKEAVTNLQWHACNNVENHAERHALLSTGRDGTVALHTITFSGGRMILKLVHQLMLPFGPNVEGVSVSRATGSLIWGFRSKDFVVFDMARQREVMALECGGAHRNWAFRPAPQGGRFVWTKASKMFYAAHSRPFYDAIKCCGHGREIRAAAVSSVDGEELIATGAEDTDIKLFAMYGNSFRCVQTLRKHNTGIQHLAWRESYLFSSGGFEEFFVWEIRRKMPVVEVGVVCESAHPRCGTSDLRIMGFDVQQADAPQAFRIAMAYSDSTLKQWRYQSCDWELLGAADYLTSCLTRVFSTNYSEQIQWTAATDGHLICWAVGLQKQTLTWTKRHKVHQNSIHEVQSVSLGGGESLIVTGGDDNAIGLTRVSNEGTLQTLLIPRAHAAAVTGLALLCTEQDTYRLVSAGIDQRIKLWQIEIDATRLGPDGLRVERLYDMSTDVADVAGIEVCALEDGTAGVMIYGVGMDVWRLP